MEDVNESSRTELDSHANMPVIGRNAYILSKIRETVDVAPFTPDYKPMTEFRQPLQVQSHLEMPGILARSHSMHLETSSSERP